MGTSGSYGGSGRQDWRSVRELFEQLGTDENASGQGGSDNEAQQQPESDLSALAGALADALANEDSALTGAPSSFGFGSILPRRGGSGGGGGGAGGVRGDSGASGRTGSASKRSVARSAARGGIVLGGAYALRSGDAAALAEIGLDLEELRAMGPRSQCARILDAVLGDGGHPDETALRAAAVEQLKAIITQETPPSEADALRGFIAAFVFQMGLVELRSDLAKGAIDAVDASKKEGRMRRYIDKRVSTLHVPTGGSMKIADFSSQADRLVREAIGLLRAR